jgi:hypothetical protein
MNVPDPWNHVTALQTTIPPRLKILLAEIKAKTLLRANLFIMAEHPTDKSRKVDVEPMASSEDSIAHGTVMDADDDLLRHIGYKQVRRAPPLPSAEVLTSPGIPARIHQMVYPFLCDLHYGCLGLRSVLLGYRQSAFMLTSFQSLPLGPLHSLLVARLLRYGVGSPVLSLHCALHFQVSMTIRANAGAAQTEQTVAELVSAYPTSGGMYFVTKQVFPEDKVPLAAWVIGWSNFLGQ